MYASISSSGISDNCMSDSCNSKYGIVLAEQALVLRGVESHSRGRGISKLVSASQYQQVGIRRISVQKYGIGTVSKRIGRF